jgi:formiminoglutamase
MGASTLRTAISRTVIDVNRDPSGASLYPGLATTELCSLTTFDGERLYRPECEPGPGEIEARRVGFFEPYHAALSTEIERLRALYPRVVLYDAHSIRSQVPRLFEGVLPNFNIGTNDGATCDGVLTRAVERACEVPRFTRVTNGRFRGGWTTRHYGQPMRGIHAIQMELACRSYIDEPAGTPTVDNWPPPYDAARAEPVRAVLREVLRACVEFARI